MTRRQGRSANCRSRLGEDDLGGRSRGHLHGRNRPLDCLARGSRSTGRQGKLIRDIVYPVDRTRIMIGQDVVYKSLPRLLRYEDSLRGQAHERVDIWALAQTAGADGPDGLDRVSRWMRVLAFSGVEIPWPVLTGLINQQTSTKTSDLARLDLIIAVNANGAPIDPRQFAQLSCQMYVNLARDVANRPDQTAPTTEE